MAKIQYFPRRKPIRPKWEPQESLGQIAVRLYLLWEHPIDLKSERIEIPHIGSHYIDFSKTDFY